MLLEFKMKNFKSFKEEMDFKMIPTQIKDLEYSIITQKSNGKEIKGLSTAVIYGANSDGKTNIISGMEVLRSIILSGNIKDKEQTGNPDIAVDRLEFVPNIKSTSEEPVEFYIKFFTGEMVVELGLSMLLGRFLDSDYDRKILKEELKINNKLIYLRTDKVEIGKIELAIKEDLIEGFSKETAKIISENNLDDKELFLNGIFKTLYSKKIYDKIIEWFQKKFRIIYRADRVMVAPVYSSDIVNNKKYYIDKSLNKALENFGLTSESIAFPITEKREQIEPLSILYRNNKKERAIVPAKDFESYGTVRFLNIFPIILATINNGNILVVDELDASIHPMAIMNIIKIFHNDEINTKGAQLIFNTHNPIFLNNSLLRRDEIKFVEKEDGNSIHYSLSDFGTNGENGVRNTEDYIKNYFVNKYGAIKKIDFSDIFRKKGE